MMDLERIDITKKSDAWGECPQCGSKRLIYIGRVGNMETWSCMNCFENKRERSKFKKGVVERIARLLELNPNIQI